MNPGVIDASVAAIVLRGAMVASVVPAAAATADRVPRGAVVSGALAPAATGVRVRVVIAGRGRRVAPAAVLRASRGIPRVVPVATVRAGVLAGPISVPSR